MSTMLILSLCVSGQSSKLRQGVAQCGGSSGGSGNFCEVFHPCSILQLNQNESAHALLHSVSNSVNKLDKLYNNPKDI